MIIQEFGIGNNFDWFVKVFYKINSSNDLQKVAEYLELANADFPTIEKAVETLQNINTGYTFTNFDKRTTIICISNANGYDELFSTITHELKHATEHISEYFNVDCKSEEAAYLQGELSKKMFKAIAMCFCPNCGRKF